MRLFVNSTVHFLAAMATDMNLGERIAYSMRMLLIGMLMVFAVLTLLWGVLALSRIAFYDMPNRKKNVTVNAKEQKAIAPVPPAAAPISITAPVADDAAVVAAITAAISATLAEEGYTGGFRVVSFRRADTGRAWNRK